VGCFHTQIHVWLGTIVAAVAIAIPPDVASAQIDSASLAPAPPDTRPSHPLDPALKMARDSLWHIQAEINDYTAVLIKRLRIHGQLQDYEFAFLKIRNRKKTNGHPTVPMAVYLNFLKPNSVKGREVIWVEGKNAGKLVAHETGYKNLFRVKLEPSGYIAMRRQRYPITEIGMQRLVEKLIETGERDRKFGECEVQIFRNAKVGDKVCTAIQVVHPIERPHFDFYRARVFFDNEHNIPIRYAAWSWPTVKGGDPVLKEEYNYTNIKLNVGLTESDFDPDNSEYNFP